MRSINKIKEEYHEIRHTGPSGRARFTKFKGKVKEVSGQLSDIPSLEAEGIDEKVAGKVQEKIGQIKKVLGK